MNHSSTNERIKKNAAYLLSVIVIIHVWYVAAKIVDSNLILPGPKDVVLKIGTLITSFNFWKSFLFTFLRVLISFILSVFIGVFLGTLCGEFNFFNNFMELPITIIRSTPVVALILIMLFWFNSNIVPIVICVLMTLPIMISSVKTGINTTNPNLVFFVKSRNFNSLMVLFRVKLINARVNILEGALQCFSLSWKVVIAGEVLCLPKKAIGTNIHISQIHLETNEVIANTIILVTISFIMEVLLKKAVKSLELKIKNN